MNSLDLRSLADWTGPVMVNGAVVAAALVVLLLALAWLWWPRKSRPAAEQSVSSSARFAAMAPIDEEQVALLRYLHDAFPEGAVLFRPPLGRFLTVRSGRDRQSARRWLDHAQVDFLLCDEEGRPQYAFEVDLLRTRDDPLAQRRLAEKNHALRTAGIRLIRFKGALSSWPLPEVLRERVLAAARPTPSSGFGASGYANSGFSRGGDASGFAPSGFTPSGFEGSQPPRAAGVPSGVMSLTDLAGLAPANQEDPWQTVRKRS
ncbi:DUF2726 domain-containing protein [Ottowia sp.]|uniref:DUF2726 domain-containing protein n=1 Tax=Ottowia sp. TaxID=1898956 RepID=UPI0025CF650C|nr:DUF2726 domain-containing protein [Ottowia sp.]